MRQRKIKVRRYTDSNRPHLKFVVNHREAGKRKRSFFEIKEQANSFAAFKNSELRRNGVEGAEFPTALRVMAQDGAEKLKPFGRTIEEACDFFVAHLKASEKSCTAVQLVRELLAAKKADGASERYLRDIRIRVGKFADKFNGRMVATITRKEIDDWLRSIPFSALTRNGYRRLVVLAFNFAVRNGYATANPALGAAKAKVVQKAPGILAVQETARLLEAASSEILPCLAVGAFAGLRRAEIERLDWSEIDFESNLIEVKAEKAKTAQRRFVTIQPNLREWLLPLRKHKGKLAPEKDFKKLFIQVRETAGLREWPANGLRHSFASYHLAHFKNAASTALELGHHDSRITFSHYRELVRPKEAARYWNIKPETSAKVVPLVTR
ncbi:MAG TPA: tyrosine-type recombinase/integrase [Candidatus Dormibacteraeota bacterium]|nr:tyrosine-type recombinase/integrase [Candidatus Dormibacteraeota bacterium]